MQTEQIIEEKLTVAEMRERLISSGIDRELVENSKKGELRDMLGSLSNAEELLSNVEVEKPQITPTDVELIEEAVIEELPSPTDKEWTPYVLSLLDPKNEMDKDGNPRLDGLRRVTEKLFGRFNSKTDIVDAPRVDNAGRATIMVRLEFLQSDYRGWTVDGAADVFSGNTDAFYARHATAVCESRAESRALRKALRLVKVVSAEEVVENNVDEPTGNDGRLPTSMANSLIIMCQRQGLDLLKVANKYGFKAESLDQLPQKAGIAIANVLGKFERGEDTVTEDIKV